MWLGEQALHGSGDEVTHSDVPAVIVHALTAGIHN